MRGYIRRRGRSWLLCVELPRDPATGRRRQQYETHPGPERAARGRLSALLAEVGKAPPDYAPTLTLAQYLERWLAYQSAQITARTLEDYTNILRQVTAAIGTVQLVKLRPMLLQAYYSSRLDAGLTPSSVRQHHRVLSAALRQAERWELISRSPAALVRPPRVHVAEREPLDAKTLSALLARLEGHRDYTLILLAAATGMRRGELFALRWQETDLERGIVKVRRAVQEAGHRISVKEPKTPRSRRDLVLPPVAVAALLRHRARQAEARLALGPAWSDEDLVFPNPFGRLENPDTFSERWRRIRARLGFPTLRFHDLRHGYGSQLLHAGHPLTAVSAQLGHQSPAVTASIYLHSLPGDSQRAAETMERLLGRGKCG